MSFEQTLIDAGVQGLGALYASGAATPAGACAAYLDRIGRLDGSLGAWVTVDAEGARAAAAASTARWAQGAPLSPLDGCLIGVKANIAVAGLPWHAGIGAYRARMAPQDAACVARLRAAGAVVLGLLNMDEGAFGAATDNPWFGRTANPWKAGHTPGGSSGGSGAAVAAGLCAAALGTDTLGSVRIPASLCGVFGHKPGWGTISTEGVTPLSPTLDHVGVIARSAEDCAAVLAIVAGVAPVHLADPRALPLAALRLRAQDRVDAAVAAAFEATLARARAIGLRVEPVDLGIADPDDLRAAVVICAAEGSAAHAEAIAADPAGFSAALLSRLAFADRQGAAAVAAARERVRAAAERTRAALAGYGALLTPASPRPSPPFGDDMRDAGRITALGNIVGWPATAFPVGLSPDGLPLSAQALAADDATTLALARLLARPIRFCDGPSDNSSGGRARH